MTITAQQIQDAAQKLRLAGYPGPYVVQIPRAAADELCRELGVTRYVTRPGQVAEITLEPVDVGGLTMACKGGGKGGRGRGKGGKGKGR